MVATREERERVLLSAAGNLQHSNIGRREQWIKPDVVPASLAVVGGIPAIMGEPAERNRAGELAAALRSIKAMLLHSAGAQRAWFQPVPCLHDGVWDMSGFTPTCNGHVSGRNPTCHDCHRAAHTPAHLTVPCKIKVSSRRNMPLFVRSRSSGSLTIAPQHAHHQLKPKSEPPEHPQSHQCAMRRTAFARDATQRPNTVAHQITAAPTADESVVDNRCSATLRTISVKATAVAGRELFHPSWISALTNVSKSPASHPSWPSAIESNHCVRALRRVALRSNTLVR